jgi:hypothetical protein
MTSFLTKRQLWEGLRVKGWNSSANVTSPPPDPELEPASLSYESVDGLKLLSKKKMPTDTDKSSS